MEVSLAPATFVKLRTSSKGTVVVAILCLHVDFGFLAVEAGVEKARVKEAIDQLFSIKEWIDVEEKPVSYLGMQIYVKDGVFYNDMNNYVSDRQTSPWPRIRNCWTL